MPHPTLFHLHFNTPDVPGAADRLERVGVGLDRRFGSVRGEGVSLQPGEDPPDAFRFKLQVHQRGAVNVTLAPGRRPHFDHVGLIVDDFEAVLDRAAARGWSVRRNERRTFAMTPWGFRVEVHPVDGAVVADLGEYSEMHLEETVLLLSEPDAGRAGFAHVFGEIPELRIRAGDGPWIDSFTIATPRTATDVDVQSLLDG